MTELLATVREGPTYEFLDSSRGLALAPTRPKPMQNEDLPPLQVLLLLAFEAYAAYLDVKQARKG